MPSITNSFREFWITGDPARRSRSVAVAACLMATYGFVISVIGGQPRDRTAHQSLVVGAALMLIATFSGKLGTWKPQHNLRLKSSIGIIVGVVLAILLIGRLVYSFQGQVATRSLREITAGDFSKSKLSKATRILKLVGNTGITIPQPLVTAAYKSLVEPEHLTNPDTSEMAQQVASSMLDYSSAVTSVPAEWVRSAVQLPGFSGLYGFNEMNNVRGFASAKRVPIEFASRVLPLRTEKDTVDLLRANGYEMWPEFMMMDGANGSNIVLDRLHLRNVILRHMHVVYGGGVARLENVAFVDCTFEFERTEKAIQLSDLILQRKAVTVGL
jgi:hypothetical protein